MASWRPKALGPVITPASAMLVFPSAPLKLQVYVRFKQTGLTGPQYVDVEVDDPNGKPLPGAALSAVVHFSNGSDRVFALMSSDANGKSSFQFDIGAQPAGTTTEIFVTANAGSLTGSGRDVFMR